MKNCRPINTKYENHIFHHSFSLQSGCGIASCLSECECCCSLENCHPRQALRQCDWCAPTSEPSFFERLLTHCTPPSSGDPCNCGCLEISLGGGGERVRRQQQQAPVLTATSDGRMLGQTAAALGAHSFQAVGRPLPGMFNAAATPATVTRQPSREAAAMPSKAAELVMGDERRARFAD